MSGYVKFVNYYAGRNFVIYTNTFNTITMKSTPQFITVLYKPNTAVDSIYEFKNLNSSTYCQFFIKSTDSGGYNMYHYAQIIPGDVLLGKTYLLEVYFNSTIDLVVDFDPSTGIIPLYNYASVSYNDIIWYDGTSCPSMYQKFGTETSGFCVSGIDTIITNFSITNNFPTDLIVYISYIENTQSTLLPGVTFLLSAYSSRSFNFAKQNYSLIIIFQDNVSKNYGAFPIISFSPGFNFKQMINLNLTNTFTNIKNYTISSNKFDVGFIDSNILKDYISENENVIYDKINGLSAGKVPIGSVYDNIAVKTANIFNNVYFNFDEGITDVYITYYDNIEGPFYPGLTFENINSDFKNLPIVLTGNFKFLLIYYNSINNLYSMGQTLDFTKSDLGLIYTINIKQVYMGSEEYVLPSTNTTIGYSNFNINIYVSIPPCFDNESILVGTYTKQICYNVNSVGNNASIKNGYGKDLSLYIAIYNSSQEIVLTQNMDIESYQSQPFSILSFDYKILIIYSYKDENGNEKYGLFTIIDCSTLTLYQSYLINLVNEQSSKRNINLDKSINVGYIKNDISSYISEPPCSENSISIGLDEKMICVNLKSLESDIKTDKKQVKHILIIATIVVFIVIIIIAIILIIKYTSKKSKNKKEQSEIEMMENPNFQSSYSQIQSSELENAPMSQIQS